MTDLEKFVELFEGFGIECIVSECLDKKTGKIVQRVEFVDPGAQVINASKGSHKLVGYCGFFITSDFDSRGKFINIGAWE